MFHIDPCVKLFLALGSIKLCLHQEQSFFCRCLKLSLELKFFVLMNFSHFYNRLISGSYGLYILLQLLVQGLERVLKLLVWRKQCCKSSLEQILDLRLHTSSHWIAFQRQDVFKVIFWLVDYRYGSLKAFVLDQNLLDGVPHLIRQMDQSVKELVSLGGT